MHAAASNLAQFAEQEQCSIIVLMGMKLIDNNPKRDLAVIKLNDDNLELYLQLIHDLKDSKELELEKVDAVEFLSAHIYRQHNAKGSRKQVLPLVQAIVDQLD